MPSSYYKHWSGAMRTMNMEVLPEINEAGDLGVNRAAIEIKLQSTHEISDRQSKQIIDKYIEAERICQNQNRLYSIMIRREVEKKVMH